MSAMSASTSMVLAGRASEALGREVGSSKSPTGVVSSGKVYVTTKNVSRDQIWANTRPTRCNEMHERAGAILLYHILELSDLRVDGEVESSLDLVIRSVGNGLEI